MNTSCAIMCFLLVPVPVLAGFHTLTGLATYVAEEGTFSASIMLDDITVGYYNSKTKIYVARGNDTNEDDVLDPNDIRSVSKRVLGHFMERSRTLRPVNTENEIHQAMGLCEQNDNKPGQTISKTAYRGSTIDEQHFLDGKYTYHVFSNYIEPKNNNSLEISKQLYKITYQPMCIKTLEKYLKKRETQLNRKVKPQVRFIHSFKTNSDSGGFRLSCLATGFYPRHINLTLFRDGQPVADHEITGGDLLPNDDGTYQMRKSLDISAADKHKYTCSITHLSLDVTLEIDPGELLKVVIPVVLIVSALVLVFATGAIVYKCRKRQADSSRIGYSATYTSEEQGEQQQQQQQFI